MPHGYAIHREGIELQTQVRRDGVAKLELGTCRLDLQKPAWEIRGLEHRLIHLKGHRLLAKVPSHLLYEHILEMHPHPDAVGAVDLRGVRDVRGGSDDELAGDSVDFIARYARQIDDRTGEVDGTRLGLEGHAVTGWQYHFQFHCFPSDGHTGKCILQFHVAIGRTFNEVVDAPSGQHQARELLVNALKNDVLFAVQQHRPGRNGKRPTGEIRRELLGDNGIGQFRQGGYFPIRHGTLKTQHCWGSFRHINAPFL